MTLWQEGMIRLARSANVKTFAQRQPWLRGLASQFVGGADAHAALHKANELASNGIAATQFYLGEYVTDPAIIDHTVAQLQTAIAAAADKSLDACASVDPTQIGLMIDEQTCTTNAARIAIAIRKAVPQTRQGHDALMIDMEDATVTDATLRLYWELRSEDLPVAITIQAYLHRTHADLDKLIIAGAWVRLVKGAFAERSRVAVRSVADRDSRYRQCATQLLSRAARESGVYPSFATHDHRLIEEIIAQAKAHDWSPEAYEFEMLYGVRPELQRDLVRRGHRVRVYLPFGNDWFPYAIRRVGESPRNLRFVTSALTRHAARPPQP
ncbi:proline dehydrogenase family protein [Propionicimonas sp.]|uniref:proline dehydrogenase family protein n=1 Tax=Propionicimonas sp. TaxID=1955623 RepID=UPI0018363C0F|nr:proline dehydrogenase family protein [Propionicimonas sp.]MBU3976758.1 proline dehydrogenase family protein [Actinomycetota bacterium]MBA3019823.1 proline dehydrogenase [Propionicimonas sp.]MBU3986853.1 proline dehydrogenase family protein [Actinomycetota bacterium]MBU4006765.1 proline dehydrogenase family protein [Actinomycetota bacterium]MBU4065465.1 proline dehydrogenase family protein [Actinomycetota bacterium]